MKRKKTSLKNALNNQPALPEVKGLSSEINLDGLEEYLTEKSPKRQVRHVFYAQTLVK